MLKDGKDGSAFIKRGGRKPEKRDNQDNMYGFPGPAPHKEGEPLRVLVCNRVARQEGQECWADYLAKGMPEGEVEWRFIVAIEDDNSGHLLREHGDVLFMTGTEEQQWWSFFRAVWDFKPHVVHTSFFLGARFAKRCGLPCVATVHGLEGGSFFGSEEADVSVGVSSAVKKDVDRVIRNGVIPLDYPEDRLENTVVWLGRTDEDRHPIPFLEAVCLVPEANVLIVGRSCQEKIDMHMEVVSRGLQNRVKVLDNLSPQEAREVASRANVVVSAVSESFGLATAELMTAGVRPVVIDGCGYQKNMAEKFGVVVRPTIAGLVEGMKEGLELSRDEDGNRCMAMWASANYEASLMSREYLEVYNSLIVPTIDVVVLAWNELAATKACVNAVLANTWTPYRLVLLNNGSEEPVADYFYSVQMAYDNVEVIDSDKNLGCPGGRSAAYDTFTDAEFFFWLDNDMIVPPNWLSPLYAIMSSDDNIAAVSPWNTIYGPHIRGKEAHDLDFHGSNNLYRRSAVEAVKEGDRIFSSPFFELNGRADSDLLCRFREANYRMVFDGTVQLYHLGGALRGDSSQGFTRRHGDTKGMFAAGDEFHKKWSSFGVRRDNDGL